VLSINAIATGRSWMAMAKLFGAVCLPEFQSV
jgi:hypothetical protein